MKVLAPLFKAFMTIFLSVGPVISTRLSSRPGAGGAHCQEGSTRIWAVSGGKSRGTPESNLRWASSRATSKDWRVDSKVRWRAARNLRAPSVKRSRWAFGDSFEWILTPVTIVVWREEGESVPLISRLGSAPRKRIDVTFRETKISHALLYKPIMDRRSRMGVQNKHAFVQVQSNRPCVSIICYMRKGRCSASGFWSWWSNYRVLTD